MLDLCTVGEKNTPAIVSALKEVYSLHCNKILGVQLLQIPYNLSDLNWSNVSRTASKRRLKSNHAIGEMNNA